MGGGLTPVVHPFPRNNHTFELTKYNTPRVSAPRSERTRAGKARDLDRGRRVCPWMDDESRQQKGRATLSCVDHDHHLDHPPQAIQCRSRFKGLTHTTKNAPISQECDSFECPRISGLVASTHLSIPPVSILTIKGPAVNILRCHVHTTK